MISLGKKELYTSGSIVLVSTPGPGSPGGEPGNTAAGHRHVTTDSLVIGGHK